MAHVATHQGDEPMNRWNPMEPRWGSISFRTGTSAYQEVTGSFVNGQQILCALYIWEYLGVSS